MPFSFFFFFTRSLWEGELIIEPHQNDGSLFGHSIEACKKQNEIVVGAEWETNDQISQLGAIYIYQISNNRSKEMSYHLVQKIVPHPFYVLGDTIINVSNFGCHVAFNDECSRIIVGAPKSTVNGIINAGAQPQDGTC